MTDETEIDHEITSILTSAILTESSDRPFEIVNYFFSNRTNYYYWEEWIWNLEDRLSGVVYTLPSPEDMLSFGLVSLILEKRLYEIVPSDTLLSSDTFGFVIDRVKTFLSEIRAASDIWFHQFNFSNKHELESDCAKVETLLSQITEKRERLSNANLTKMALDPTKIANFKSNMEQQWKESENLGKVFEFFDGVEINPARELKRIGLNVNAENLKFAFTKSNNEFPVVGIDFGKEVARNKEQLLGRVLFDERLPFSSESNIVSGLINGIAELQKRQFTATVIFSTYRSLLREEINLNNSGKYIPAWRQNVSSFPFAYLGVFENNIPIIRIHSDLYKDFIIVADLEKAIKMFQRENDNWFQKRLQIDIKEIDREKAIVISKRQNKDANSPDFEDQLNKIMCGVIIDIDEICDFSTINKDALQIFKLK